MKTRYKGISETPNKGVPEGIGQGYIVIPENYPSGTSRDIYVEDCYRKEKVAVMPERGGTPNWECSITKEALKNIYFPETSRKLGSAVIFFSDRKGSVMVIGTVSKLDESSLEQENILKEKRVYQANDLTVIMNPKSGMLLIEGKSKDTPIELSINLANISEDCELNIGVSGGMSINLSGDYKLDSDKIFNKAGKVELNMEDNKIEIKNEVENLKTIIDDFMTQITMITVPTGTGPSGVPVNSAAIQAIKTRLSLIMS